MTSGRSARPETKHFLSIREWAELKGIELDRSQAIRLGMIVKGDYKKKYGRDPRQAYRKQPDTGKTINIGSGYEAADLPLIEAGLNKIENTGARQLQSNLE